MFADPTLREYLSPKDKQRLEKQQAIDESRRIREEQEKEFNESLRKDQQKQEDEEFEEAMRLSMEIDKATKMSQKKESLAKLNPSTMTPEELKGREKEVCEIVICLPPDGKRITRKFFIADALQTVRDWIEVYVAEEGIERTLAEDFQLVTTFPKEVLSDPSKTLQELNLYPRSILNLSNP
eukprot:gene8139-9553_t